jgi:dethiobiotin synthetase
MNYRGLAIAGTDTGVGKTAVGCGLARLLVAAGKRVGVFKPVETGCEVIAPEGARTSIATHVARTLLPADGLALATAAGLELGRAVTLDDVVPWRFEVAVAPEEAARLVGVEISVDRIYQAMDRWMDRSDFTLVETAGGLMAPINARFLNADLLAGLELPVLVVASDRLGVINHALLTLEALRRRGLIPLAIVLNRLASVADLSAGSNAQLLREHGGVPVYEVPFSPDPARAAAEVLRPHLRELMRFDIAPPMS